MCVLLGIVCVRWIVRQLLLEEEVFRRGSTDGGKELLRSVRGRLNRLVIVPVRRTPRLVRIEEEARHDWVQDKTVHVRVIDRWDMCNDGSCA